MGFLKTLKLYHFRCYGQTAIHNLECGLVVLTGANGAGKTNILEAVSLLSPGRGVRGARMPEIQKQGSQDPWAISAILQTRYEDVQLATGLDPAKKNGEKRIIRINGKTEKSQNAFGKYLSCVWMTPQMDRLFLDSVRDRRLFLDRLVFSFDSGHAGRITRYDKALTQRSKLLRDGVRDDVWLSGLEQQMAETGVAIAAARLEFVNRLQWAIDQEKDHDFPRARISVEGVLEKGLSDFPALEMEEKFKVQLVASRGRDSVTGGAVAGSHKSDLRVVYHDKDMPADQCSTGEQKGLLMGIILAHAQLVRAERGVPPLILLDEVAAHLDEKRRSALYDILRHIGAQVWLTGTDENLFSSLRHKVQFLRVDQGTVTEESA